MSDKLNPYASPQTVEPSRPPAFERGIIPFESGRPRAVWAIALLGLVVVLEVAYAANCAMRYKMLADIQRGQVFPQETLEASDARYAEAARYLNLSLIPTAIAFLMWTHRAYRNLPALGANGLEHSPRWAVGWYFVPIANLVKPYLVTAEIWRNSDPDAIGAPSRAVSVAPVVFWWIAFLARGVMSRIAAAMFMVPSERQTLKNLMDATMWEVIVEVVSVIAALLAILVIYTIDKNQKARFERIKSEAPVAVNCA